MTDLQTSPPPSQSRDSSDRARKIRIIAVLGAVALIAVGFLVWYFMIRDTSPASVDSAEAAEARQEALDAAAGDPPAEAQAPAPDNPPPAEAADPPPAEPEAVEASFDGVWRVDTTIGTFDDACLTEVCDSTFVGFRIDEELAGFGAKTVVGRTPGVTGSLEIAGTTITTTDIVVDMTGLITDSGSRNRAIRNQAIETSAFPEASFVLTEPLEFGAIPADGEEIVADAVGDLTVHGVTRSETISLTAQVAGDVIVVFGQLGPILLADYDIDKPTAANVLSVEDNAIMELQLFFTR